MFAALFSTRTTTAANAPTATLQTESRTCSSANGTAAYAATAYAAVRPSAYAAAYAGGTSAAGYADDAAAGTAAGGEHL